MNTACAFCAIAAGEPHAGILIQDAYTVTLLDLSQDHYGHLLITPRHHYSDIRNMSEIAIDAVILAVKRAAQCIDREFPGAGVRIWQSTHNTSIPDIMHAHFHVQPRRPVPVEVGQHTQAGDELSATSSPAFIERLRRHLLDMELIPHDHDTGSPAIDRHHGFPRRDHTMSFLWCGCSEPIAV